MKGAEPPDRLVESRVERYALFDRVNRPYLEWQVEQFRPFLGQRILEVGCGVGSILELLSPRELLFGIDVDEEVLSYAKQRFQGDPGRQLSLLDLTEAKSETLDELRARRFDTVVSINVLEHLRDDVEALRRIESLVSPGGILALLVPAHEGLYGAYDALEGHFRRYSKSHLRAVLRSTSFEVVGMRYFNLVGALGWWIQYKLLRRQIHGSGHFGIMNRLVPIMRRLEDLVSPPFGLSLVAICRRPATGDAE